MENKSKNKAHINKMIHPMQGQQIIKIKINKNENENEK